MGQDLQQLLDPTVSGLGYELLGVERSTQGESAIVRLYIDSPKGITVDDCAVVSRQVGDVLEVEEAIRGDYVLEVSSPGMDRPLFTLDQYRRFVGENVNLQLRRLMSGRRRLKGRLHEVTDESVVVEVDGEVFEVPYRDIERSRLVPEWQSGRRRQS